MAAQPWLWIIGGPNGAGKTTFCMVILPQMVKTFEYVNADLIAAGLSPLDPARAPLRAGRLMMERVEELMKDGKTFAVESTLAGRTFLDLAQRAKIDSWKVGVVYLWLASDQVALKRVAARVKQGGHDIPAATVKRRRKRGLEGLHRYLDVADRWIIFDNSGEAPQVVANAEAGQVTIRDAARMKQMRLQ